MSDRRTGRINRSHVVLELLVKSNIPMPIIAIAADQMYRNLAAGKCTSTVNSSFQVNTDDFFIIADDHFS